MPLWALDSSNDRCTNGTVTAFGTSPVGEDKDKAFDDNTATKWLCQQPTAWIAYQFGGRQRWAVTNYTLTSGNDSPDRDPRNWTLEGSNDGSDWRVVDARTGVGPWAARNTSYAFACSNTASYEYYRLNITAYNGATITQLSEIELFGERSPAPEFDNWVSATNVNDNSACLSGILSSTGGSATAVMAYWGTNDWGTNATAWTGSGSSSNMGVQSVGVVTCPVGGLNLGGVYWFRLAASNDAGVVWSPAGRFVANTPPFGGWTRRAKVTFTGYTKSDVLSGFPVLVTLGPNVSGFDYGDFLSGTNDDLRFTDATEARALNYEVDTWNTNGASLVWVQVPRLASSNDYIWAYWRREGQAPASCTTDGSTWSNGFLAVWHFGQTNGAADLRDSTANRNDATNGASTSVAGCAGTAQGFASASNQYVALPYSSRFLPSDTNLTVSAWVKPTVNNSGTRYFNLSRGGGSSALILYLQSNGTKTQLQRLNGGGTAVVDATATGSFTAAKWNHLAWTYDVLVGATLCMNGARDVASVAPSGAGAAGGAEAGKISGNIPGSGNFYDGAIDEVRVSSVVRSPAWSWAEYATMSTNGGFAQYGAAAVVGGMPEPAAIATLPPVSVRAGGADVAGVLSSTGTSVTALYLRYGESDGSSSGTWDAMELVADEGVVQTYTNTLSLSTDRTYYYQYAASNSMGWRYGGVRSFITAPITVAKASDASEVGLTPGTFTVSRASSATGIAVTVGYTVTGGTASNGVDYVTPAGTVTIPAGASSAPIVITPKFDRVSSEGPETVQVTLLSGTFYPLGSPATATMEIVDNASLPESLDLIWDDASGNLLWDQSSLNWHVSGSANGSCFFNNGDSVTFPNPASSTTISLNNQTQSVKGVSFTAYDSTVVTSIGTSAGNGSLVLGSGGISEIANQYCIAVVNCNVQLATNASVVHTNAQRSITFNGWVDTAGYSLTCVEGGQGHTYNGNVKGTGAVTCTTGVVTFNGSNSFSGVVTAGNGGTVSIAGSAGSFLNASNVVIANGGALSIGDTGYNVPDDGITTFGRIRNTQGLTLYGGTPLVQDGVRFNVAVLGNGASSTERVGNVTFRVNWSGIDVRSTTFVPAALVRDPESRPLGLLRSSAYNLGSGSYLKPVDGAAGLTQIGGDGSRLTNKKVVPWFTCLSKSSTWQSHPDTLVTFNASNGFVQLNPAMDFVLGTSSNAFPAVNADGYDNVRLLYSGAAPTGGASTVSLAGDTAVNSLVFDSDYASSVNNKAMTLTGPAGSTLTINSGVIMAAPSGASGGNMAATLNVPSVSFGAAEGVVTLGNRDGGSLLINSALSGTNGLTVFQDGWGGNPIFISGANSNLTGQITIGSSLICVSSSVYALGSGSNDLFLTGGLSTDVGVSGGRSVTVKSVKGFGKLTARYNNPSFNIGGDGTLGAANTLMLTNNGTISPGEGDLAGTLTFESFATVKLMGGRVAVDLFGSNRCDRVAFTGAPAVRIGGSSLAVALHYPPSVGDTFLVMSTAGTTTNTGKFAQGDSVMAVYDKWKATFDILYNSNLAGGDGNDVVLRVSLVEPHYLGTMFGVW